MKPVFTIELPREGDEIALAPMHVRSWKETYVPQDEQLTEAKVDELLSHITSDTSFRLNTIRQALAEPERVLYRVVKNEQGDVVGFLHGEKYEDRNELEGLYLLNEAKGQGIGGKLMAEFLAWIDVSKPCRLRVFSFNESAIAFYEHYGFVRTNAEVELYKNLLPMIEMERVVEA